MKVVLVVRWGGVSQTPEVLRLLQLSPTALRSLAQRSTEEALGENPHNATRSPSRIIL